MILFYSYIRMAIIQKTLRILIARQGWRAPGKAHLLLVRMQNVIVTLETVWQLITKLTMVLPLYLRNAFQGIYETHLKTYVHTYTQNII